MHKVALWIQEVLIPALGPPGLFVMAFCDSSFLTVPEINDFLVVSSSTAHPSTAWLYISMATLGSLGGSLLLWALGRRGGEPLLLRRFGKERVEQTRSAFKRWDVLALAIPAVLPPPMPFKIFVLSAGVFGFPCRRFVATLLVARGLRYTFWGALGVLYGERAVEMLREMDAWLARQTPVFLAVACAAAVAGLLVYARRRRGASRDDGRA